MKAPTSGGSGLSFTAASSSLPSTLRVAGGRWLKDEAVDEADRLRHLGPWHIHQFFLPCYQKEFRNRGKKVAQMSG